MYEGGRILFLVFLGLTNCTINPGSAGFQQKISSRALSLNDPLLRTCVFDPGYSIIHFPMYHVPPQNQSISNESYELVVKSQFQLLHTIIDYNRSNRRIAVFDEHIITDSYNQNYIRQLEQNPQSPDTFSRLDGTEFFITERKNLAVQLFQNGFPAFYEHLTEQQKRYLWDVGASLTLYFLKEISRLYKVIDSNKFDLVKANLGYDFSSSNVSQNSYWAYEYRERELKLEVQNFYRVQTNWNGLILISYGKNHDFSDNFLGYPFQSGHSFCLNWNLSQSLSSL